MSEQADEAARARAQRNAEIEAIKQEMLAGKKTVVVNTKKKEEEEHSSSSSSSADSETSSSSSDEDEEQKPSWTEELFPFQFPLIRSGHHYKAVTSVALDKNGTRMVTGSLDGNVLVWDTSRLSQDLKPFRTLATTSTLTGGATDQAVTRIMFNSTNALFAVARSDPQVRIYNRDGTNGTTAGEAKVTTTRGDPYIRDMSKTKGHVGGVSDLLWSSLKPEVLFTGGSQDGTIRIWDVEHGPKALMGLELACSHILKTPAKPGARTGVQAFARSKTSTRLAAGCSGNILHLWDVRAGGVFGALPDKGVACSNSVNDFVAVAFDDEVDWRIVLGQKDSYEVRDLRKLEVALWTRTRLPSLVKSVGFHGDLVVAACADQIVLHDAADGKDIGREKEQGLVSSNFVWTCTMKDRMVRGRTDGSIVFSFNERTGRDLADTVVEPLASKKAVAPRDDGMSFARVDQSKLAREDQGIVMPAHEAFSMMKGGKKRMKGEEDLS